MDKVVSHFFFFGELDVPEKNVGKFVPYLYRTIFNDKVDYLEVKTLTITQWEKVRYKDGRDQEVHQQCIPRWSVENHRHRHRQDTSGNVEIWRQQEL